MCSRCDRAALGSVFRTCLPETVNQLSADVAALTRDHWSDYTGLDTSLWSCTPGGTDGLSRPVCWPYLTGQQRACEVLFHPSLPCPALCTAG